MRKVVERRTVPPADVADIRQFLTTYESLMAEMRGRNPGAPAWTTLTHEAIIARLGKEYTPAKRPPGMRKGRNGLCFRNTAHLILTRPELRYVEGFAMSPLGMLPTLHAWAADEQGTVIDPTWKAPERCAYVGVEIPYDSLAAMLVTTREYGFFAAEWKVGHPIRKLGRIPSGEEIRESHEDCIRRSA